MNDSPYILLPLLALTATAAAIDIRSRRIPNALTGPGLLLGLVVQTCLSGRSGLGAALAGMLVAGGLLLPGWFAGWTGAGDVKLMAVVGAWLGFPQGVIAALLALVAGGVLALIVAVRHKALVRSLRGAGALAAWAVSVRSGAAFAQPVTSGLHFPFAVAVLVGTCAALWVKP